LPMGYWLLLATDKAVLIRPYLIICKSSKSGAIPHGKLL